MASVDRCANLDIRTDVLTYCECHVSAREDRQRGCELRARMSAPFIRVPFEQAQEERHLLELGLTVADVAERVGASARRVGERNRHLYQIDLSAAFQRRIDREGLPTRLSVETSFGYWFAGLFDGEGHFVMRMRRRPTARGSMTCELELGLNVYLRDDDSQVLERVQAQLGGVFSVGANNVARWRFRGLRNLAEIAVPLFLTYPLLSKKAEEFEVFRRLVIQRYVATLGGRHKRAAFVDAVAVEEALAGVRARRRYANRSSWAIRESALAYDDVSFQVA